MFTFGWELAVKLPVLVVPFVFVLIWYTYHLLFDRPAPKRAARIVSIWALGSLVGLPALLGFLFFFALGIGLGSGDQAGNTVLVFLLLAIGALWHFGIVVVLPYVSWKRRKLRDSSSTTESAHD